MNWHDAATLDRYLLHGIPLSLKARGDGTGHFGPASVSRTAFRGIARSGKSAGVTALEEPSFWGGR